MVHCFGLFLVGCMRSEELEMGSVFRLSRVNVFTICVTKLGSVCRRVFGLRSTVSAEPLVVLEL